MSVPQGKTRRPSCAAVLRTRLGWIPCSPQAKKEVDPNWWKPMTLEEMEREGWQNDLEGFKCDQA